MNPEPGAGSGFLIATPPGVWRSDGVAQHRVIDASSGLWSRVGL
jgi:hypothetical protein